MNVEDDPMTQGAIVDIELVISRVASDKSVPLESTRDRLRAIRDAVADDVDARLDAIDSDIGHARRGD